MKRVVALFVFVLLLTASIQPGFGEPDAVDLDLSVMPLSIAYAQAVAMLREPSDYVGQTVRVSGVFNYSEARQKGVCIVADVSGCCETSLDFICADDLAYPGDYPDLYSRITVVGRFEPCADAEGAYCLTDAGIEAN